MKSMRKILLSVATKSVLITWGLIASAFAVSQPSISPEMAWFKPQLIENNDAICDSLLADATDKFFSEVPDSEFYSFYKLRGRGVHNIKGLKLLGGQEVSELQAYGTTFYLHSYRHPGCGGACEAYQSLVSPTPFSADADRSFLSKQAALAPPADSYDYLVAQSETKIPYLLVSGDYGTAKHTLKTYRLSEQGQWKAACVISFKPDLSAVSQQGLRDVKVAVQQLEQAANNMRLGAGYCGSMHTHLRWGALLTEKLEQTLYRPWSVKSAGTYHGNAFGLYEHVIENLKIWSLTGIQAAQAFDMYSKQLIDSKQEMATFYRHSYQWSEPYASKMADEALTGAVAYGFGFYMYNTGFYEKEGALREAILHKAPMDEVKKLASDIDSDDSQCCADYGSKETLLNIAINYPEALQYLLELGLDPNQQNEFGKTPLMYAAQSNQLESVAILLNKKADPNLSTIIPQDTCYYTLSKSGMRALHYAVRYASSELIKLLIENGADPIVTTSEQTGGYPIDWMHKYTSAGAEEVNANIPADEIPALEKLLALPTAEEMGKLVLKLNAEAEKAYAEKNLKEAYVLTQKVLQLQPVNERALSNLGLIALKLEKTEIALEAIQKLIDHGTDKKMIANAWYNYGMICDATKSRVYYNGQSYCASTRVHNYLSSYVAAPSEVRKNKLLEVIDSSPKVCHFKTGKIKVLTECGSSPWKNKICVVYPSETAMDLSGFSGTYKNPIVTKKNVTVTEDTPVYLNKAAEAYDMGDKSFGVYYPKGRLSLPIKWDGEVCNEDFSVSVQ